MQITKYGNGRTVVAVVSDLHINSTVGLCPPRVKLDDGGYYYASDFQAKLWEKWNEFWTKVQIVSNGNSVVVIVNGDAVDGDHHRTSQIVTSNLYTQHAMAVETLETMRKIASIIFFVRGTEIHVGGAGMDEEAIAREIGAEQDSLGNFSRNLLQIDLNGVRIDSAHHGSIGRLPWTTINAAMSLSVRIELKYSRHGFIPPKVAFRSHFHRWVDTYDNSPVRLVGLPGWQGLTGYTYRVLPDAPLPQIGGVIMEVDSGSYSLVKERYTEENGSETREFLK